MLVTTASGAVYRIKDHTLTRLGLTALRKDGEPIPIVELITLQKGRPLEVLLDLRGDGIYTYRVSTDVIEIEESDE